jgi:glycosyltransferase involved in cell wall biosynthesis
MHEGGTVMEDDPKVTIIIPTFKRPTYLKRAVYSVLNQTYRNIELIVVDDNNEGDKYRKETQVLMEGIYDKRVKYIRHKRNKNGAAARNTGIAYSKGSYIAFLDDDDEFMPNRIEVLVKKMESLDKSWGICYTGYTKYIKNMKIIRGKEKIEGNAFLQALMRNIYLGAGSNLFVRREVVKEVEGFDESFERNQDIEFLLRVLNKFKIKYIDEELLIVHYEVRDRVFTYHELKKVDDMFVNTFQKYIKNLKEEEKVKFFQMMAINDFRYALNSKELRLISKSLLRPELKLNLLLRYIFYLLKRYVTKSSYGFRI